MGHLAAKLVARLSECTRPTRPGAHCRASVVSMIGAADIGAVVSQKGRDASLTRVGITVFFGLLFGVPGLSVGVALGAAIVASPFAWSDMDWNGDGRTSVTELLESADVGVRATSQGGQACTEFFSLKDGLTLRVRCR